MSDRQKGKVKWFNPKKGYGFIQFGNGQDAFVHFNSIIGEGYRSLLADQEVEFTLKHGDKGLQAENVKAVVADREE
jgi:CspA family cold shock protein